MWWQFSESVVLFLHGGLLSQNNRAGLGVSMDLQMSTQAAECECDLDLELRWNGVLARAFPPVSWWTVGQG